jgi:hypothetical protein
MLNFGTFLLGILAVTMATPALGGFESGSDGSDGVFNPQMDVEIDLALAATGIWDTPSPVAGQGVYDPDEWAVVFKFASIDIPEGVTVTFSNHPSGAPVFWLVAGDAIISGEVSLDGDDGSTNDDAAGFTEPGPGGFQGGRRGYNSTNLQPSAGLGPGGGRWSSSVSCSGGGGFGTSGGPTTNCCTGAGGGGTYGNTMLTPLIGGSGGAGVRHTFAVDAGAGAGAILVAASGDVLLNGLIIATGGEGGFSQHSIYAGGGSGGAIRIVADRVSGQGSLRALGGRGTDGSTCVRGGAGRIRVEDTDGDIELTDGGNPLWTSTTPRPLFSQTNSPTLKATLVSGALVPADPIAGILTTDVEIQASDTTVLEIEASNIPAGTTVEVRILPTRGHLITATSTPLDDIGGGILTATAAVPNFPVGQSEVQLRANWTP